MTHVVVIGGGAIGLMTAYQLATDGAEVTRTQHTAPPTLDEHGASVRRWLEEQA